MRTVNSFLLGMLFISLIGCGEPAGTITIKGTVTEPAEGLITLNAFGEKGMIPVDTITLDADGQFSAKVTVTTPTFYRLSFYNKQFVNVILKGTESEVEMTLKGTDPQEKAVVTGAPENAFLDKFDEIFKFQNEDVQALNQEAIQARMNQDDAQLEKITNDYYALMEKNQEKLKAYITSIAPSIAVFYGLGPLKPEEHMPFFEELAAIFQKELPEHPLTKNLSERVSSIRKLQVGSEAPEIALPDVNGEVISLSSLRGKYVLIDFWAAWCRPCREENPNVVRVYNTYKDKNFEILGVSLDRNKEAWIKAINDDKLPWLHISDLKYFGSEAAATYGIEAIPATYLIGPDGKILAKGLRGPSLEQKLKEIFG